MTSSSHDTDDATWVARLRAGDEQAFAHVFFAYAGLMCDVAMHYVHTRDIAQELVQDVFCRIWERRDALVVREGLRVYLFAAVRNRALNHLKHERVERRVAEEMPAASELPGMGTAPVSPDAGVIDTEQRQLIEAAIDALPERQRMVFRFRWQHNLSYDEIGTIMGLSKKGVESARARALESLQQKLRRVLGG